MASSRPRSPPFSRTPVASDDTGDTWSPRESPADRRVALSRGGASGVGVSSGSGDGIVSSYSAGPSRPWRLFLRNVRENTIPQLGLASTGTSNGRYRGLEYTHEVWRSDFEVAQTSCATPREAWRHTLHGAGSGLLGKHRMSQTEEHLLEAPHSRAISET